MSRDASAAYLAALQAQVTRPAIFFEGLFGTSGTLRLWSGLGPVTWNSASWTGAGTLLGVSEVDEPTDVVAAGFSVSLSGIPTDLVSMVINDVQQGDQGRIWIGLLDASGAIIVDPVLLASGRMDVPTITDDIDTCTIEVSYEGRLIDLQRAREWRYTHESQQQIYAGDRGFEYVASLQDKEIIWGQPSPTGGAVTSSKPSSPTKLLQGRMSERAGSVGKVKIYNPPRRGSDR